MARSYGTASQLLVLKESTYGTAPGGNYEKMSFFSSSLGAEQALVKDPLLGLGREPRTPFHDIIKAEGDIQIAVEPRDFGRWLEFLMGTDTVTSSAATGDITFTANPSAGQTITLNGVTWTFVSTTPTGAETEIQSSLAATITQLASDLTASSNSSLTVAAYAAASPNLNITYDTAGPAGNAYTLASGNSNATPSGATLSGGGYTHTFISGASSLPSFTAEIGHLNVPAYFVNSGCMLDSMALDFQRSGGSKATLKLMGQNETLNTATGGGTPTTRSYLPFSQFNGQVLRNGSNLGNVVSAKLNYSNGLQTATVIRPDALIDGIDPSSIAATGSLDIRFADTTLFNDAISGNAIELQLGYQFSGIEGNDFSIQWTFHSIYLPRPKMQISGPGGVQASFNWEAAYDESLGKSVTVTLKNDVSAYA